uniref:Aspartate semialdehyde dehydrogenase n=1 Tax=mine drainage metagenome TaxID=410659 RepID=E6QLH5_9ZZZZ
MSTALRIGIVGASSPLGKELKEALSESSLAESHFTLLDEQEAQGRLDQIGDEATVVQAATADSFDGLDFAFFAGSAELTRRWWKTAIKAGATVIDLTATLDEEPGVLVRSPWLDASQKAPDLLTQAVVPANAAALTLALLLEGLEQRAEVRFAAAMVLQPVSEYGAEALDELHQQTVSLLSFQSVPQAVFDTQAAYNLVANYGESAKVNLADSEARIRRHFAALAGERSVPLRLQVIHAPVFHGVCCSVCIELATPIALAVLEDAMSGEHLDLVMEATDSPSNLSAVGEDDVLVWIKPEPAVARLTGETSRFWLWAASDNLRLAARNAVDCALDLRRLRPRGTVQ